MQKMLTVAEVAESLRVSEWCIKRLLNKGKLKGVKIGAAWRVFEEDLKILTSGNKKPVEVAA